MKKGWSEQKVRNTILNSEEHKQLLAKEAVQKRKEELQQETEKARKTEEERLRARLKFYEGRIKSVETRLVNVIPNPPNINFGLVESKEVGAWSGGSITTGMMEFLYADSVASTDDQLAMVLAHEIAHVQLKYGVLIEMLNNELKNAKEPLWAKLIAVVDSQTAEKIFNSLIIDGLKKDFSRDQESAADFFGLLFVRRAGFNVQQAIKFFERQKENSIIAYIRDHIETHPSMRTRYETLVKQIEEIANEEIEKLRKAEEKKKQLEARYVGIVTRAYKDILKRTPDQGGLQTYVDFMKKGWSEQKVRNTLLGSQEYKQMIAKETSQKQKSIQIGSTVMVVNTDGIGLRLRSSPGLKYPEITNLPDGTRMKVIGGPVQANGYTWWKVQDNPGTGWCVGNWLAP